jgi:putative ABC transport system permease protein
LKIETTRMFKNYITIAFRKFSRNKIFSLINILGLGIGISAALVIYLVVQHEFNYEKFQKDGDRIYRVVSVINFPGDAVFKNSGVPMPMPVAMRNEFTGLDAATHFVTSGEQKVQVSGAANPSSGVFKKQKDIIYADQFYFSVFDYEWVAGSKQVALNEPFAVVLTESRAKTYFGDRKPADIIDQKLTYSDTITASVAGIVKDPDSQGRATDFRFKEFISMQTMLHTGIKARFDEEEWGNVNSDSQLFIKLNKKSTKAQVEAQMAGLWKKYNAPKKDDEDAGKFSIDNSLQPLGDIHFNADYDAFGNRQAHKQTLYGLLAVAAFLLLLGCINFINLTTAQSALRAREIGIRKTAGSSKKQLITQFLSETLVLTLFATIVSLAISPWLLHIFGDFIPPEVGFFSINQPHVWLFLALLTVVVAGLAGFYPALVLTRFQPVNVLKSQLYSGNSRKSKAWLRKTLTITQFVIAQFLIIATLIVSKQIHYSLNRDMGYKKDAIVTLNTPRDFYAVKEDRRRFALLEIMKSMPGIETVTLAGSAPASNNTSSTTMKVNNGKEMVEKMVEVKNGGKEYFDVYKMKLKYGQWPQASDTVKEYLINETFARQLGFAKVEDAVGHFVEGHGRHIPIIGVVADFNTKSTHSLIGPLAFGVANNNSYTLHFSLRPRGNDPDRWKNTLAKVEGSYKGLYPGEDFNYQFFDDSIASFYKAEKDISRLLQWAAGLCIFISCLGLLGLVMYITNTRTKEIGVRKVLGATSAQIVALLSKDFIALVMVAFAIALPLAWWAMHHWLQDFAYRTAMSWWIFAITGLGMILIAVLILSMRTVKAALENPVRSLRSE